MKVGKIASVSIAFGTSTATGATGNMTSDCNAKANNKGMYADSPDVSVTFQ